MSIVIITIPGKAHKAFVNALHRNTGGAVKLVIIQSASQPPIHRRLARFVKKASTASITKELWYALLLRLNPRIREALTYFQANSDVDEPYLPPTMYVSSVNSDDVLQKIKSINPSLLTVWGCAVLDERIYTSAKNAINLHLGLAPHYRGALANQHAVLLDDYNHIGATIHYIHKNVDAGDVIEQVRIDPSLPPYVGLRQVTSEAFHTYLMTAQKIYAGQSVPKNIQRAEQSNVLLLKQWLPSLRYRVGKYIYNREKTFQTTSNIVNRRQYIRFAAAGLILGILSTSSYILIQNFLQCPNRINGEYRASMIESTNATAKNNVSLRTCDIRD